MVAIIIIIIIIIIIEADQCGQMVPDISGALLHGY